MKSIITLNQTEIIIEDKENKIDGAKKKEKEKEKTQTEKNNIKRKKENR